MHRPLLLWAAILWLGIAVPAGGQSCSLLQPEDPAFPAITANGAPPGRVIYSNYDSPDYFVTYVLEYSTSPTFDDLGVIANNALENYTYASALGDSDVVQSSLGGGAQAGRFTFTKRTELMETWLVPAGTTLRNGQTYYFRNYKIRDSCGVYAKSSPVLTTPSSLISFGAPSTARNVSANILDGSSIALAWLGSADAGDGTSNGTNVSYQITYNPEEATAQPIITYGLSQTISGLQRGVIYQVNVTARNQFGPSSPTTILLRPVNAPSPPSNARLSVNPRNLPTLEGNTEWYIEWDPPSDSGAGTPTAEGLSILSYRLYAEEGGTNLTVPRQDNATASFRVDPPVRPASPFTPGGSNTTRVAYSISAANLQVSSLGFFSQYGTAAEGEFVVGRPPVMSVAYSPACSPYCADGINTDQVLTPSTSAGINTVPLRCSESAPPCFASNETRVGGLIGPPDADLAADNVSAPASWVSLCSGGACMSASMGLPDIGFDFPVFGANVRSAMNATGDATVLLGGGGAAAYAGAGGVEARRVFYRLEPDAFTVRWEGCISCGSIDWGLAPGVIAEITFRSDGTLTVSAGEHRSTGGAWGVGISAGANPMQGGTAMSLSGGAHASSDVDLGADPTPIAATVGVFIRQTQEITVSAVNPGGGGSIQMQVDAPLELTSAGGDVWSVSSSGGAVVASVKALVGMATRKYKVCFTAIYGSGVVNNLRSQLCMLVHILGPNPSFQPIPPSLSASIGCSFNVSLTALDLTEANLPLPVVKEKGYFLRIVMGTMTRSSRYRDAAVYTPKSAVLTPDTWVVNNSVSYTFRWVPSRFEEGWDYSVCFEAKGFIDGITISGVGSGRFACTNVRVERCRFCSGSDEGTSLALLAAEWRTNWLAIWSGNHALVQGDSIPRDSVIQMGPLSRATLVQGCTLGDELCMESVKTLATRYGVTEQDVLWWNPDLYDEAFSAGGSILKPGQEICVLPNTCMNNAHIDTGGF